MYGISIDKDLQGEIEKYDVKRNEEIKGFIKSLRSGRPKEDRRVLATIQETKADSSR